MLNSKDAAYTTALGEKRNLEAEVKDLKAQLAKVKSSLIPTEASCGFRGQERCISCLKANRNPQTEI